MGTDTGLRITCSCVVLVLTACQGTDGDLLPATATFGGTAQGESTGETGPADDSGDTTGVASGPGPASATSEVSETGVDETGEGSETGGPPSDAVVCHAEEIPFRSEYLFPDHTTWGDNMYKVGRLGDRVFTFYSDNSEYCIPNAPPGSPTCAAGQEGDSYLRVLRKEGADGPWERFDSLAFPTVRPGNLLVTPECVHALVFEPHPDATRASDRIGGLKHYWFPPDFGSDAPPTPGQEWVVPPPASAQGPENVNIRIGASMAPDGRMLVAWGLPDNTMNGVVRDGGGCFGGGWSSVTAESGLDFSYFYPRIHVGGGDGQQYYTSIGAVMDDPTPTICAGGPTNESGAPIYRKINYWEDSRNGVYRRETAVDLWNPCAMNDGVKTPEVYIDRASRSHLITTELLQGSTVSIEHWIKPGDSFASDPALSQGPCTPSNPCGWTHKLVLDWGSVGINWIRLFEHQIEDGTYELYYIANSWNRVFIGRVDEQDQDASDLVELALPDGWMETLAGPGLYTSNTGGGTDAAEPVVDVMLPSGDATYYLRLDKGAVAALFDGGPPQSVTCEAN